MARTTTASASTSAAAASRARPSTCDGRLRGRTGCGSPTPAESTPEAVAASSTRSPSTSSDEPATRPIGVTVPAVVKHGVVRTAANIDQTWIGTDAETLLERARSGAPVHVVNDADAAGVAEAAVRRRPRPAGLVLMTTLGTGIGIGAAVDGVLCPTASWATWRSTATTPRPGPPPAPRATRTSWEQWAERLQRYFGHVEDLLWPDLIVVGGGVSKKAEQVPAAAAPAGPDRAGPAAERRRHRRRGLARRGRAPAASGSGARSLNRSGARRS